MVGLHVDGDHCRRDEAHQCARNYHLQVGAHHAASSVLDLFGDRGGT